VARRTPYSPSGPRAVTLLLAIVIGVASTAPLPGQVGLSSESDRAAFRGWFVLLADAAFYRPVPEVGDCAGLIRYAAREALRHHTPEWRRTAALPLDPGLPDVTDPPEAPSGHFPLFRVSADRTVPYAEFADARTIVRFNTRQVARDAAAAHPGDLLYFQQPSQHEPDHLMIFVGPSRFDPSAEDFVVYHTGPADDGGPGEMRKVRLADLLRHPAPRWRPVPSNHRFVGVFRLSLS
jgi:uncharacterized protein YfaT (DUF1175 family)